LLLQKAALVLIYADGLQLRQEGALSYGSVDTNCRFKIPGFSYPDENTRRFDGSCGGARPTAKPSKPISTRTLSWKARAGGRRFNFYNFKGTLVLQRSVEAFLFMERG